MNSSFISRLVEGRDDCAKDLLRRQHCYAFLHSLLGVLFPHFDNRHLCYASDITSAFADLKKDLAKLLQRSQCNLEEAKKQEVLANFFAELPSIYDTLVKDAEAILAGDPAAVNLDEIILAYPGFWAIAVHRLSHALYKQGVLVLPRVFSEFAHERTGIDIHPGAEIAEYFCIDHGTGIVIGETCQIAKNVKIYQGVTLGALSVDKSFAATKRHPTIEEGVVIYAGTTILGGETVVGAGSIIGGNVWLTESVPANSRVYHRAEKTIR